jgi:transcriptional regulator with XRE-family HTH domain
MTSELIRAARALLRWEQRQLAEASSVSLPTVKRLEAKAGSLAGHASTVAALVSALEAAGIEFTNGERPGVRLAAATAAEITRKNAAKARSTMARRTRS